MDSKIIKSQPHVNMDGTFVPKTDIVFPENPNSAFLSPNIIKEIKVDNDYHFLPTTFSEKLWNIFTYFIIFLLVFPVNKIRYGLKIMGRKNLRKNKKLFKNGAITVSNHVYRWDYLSCLQAVRYRRMWFPARYVQLCGKDGTIIKGAGGIPIPPSISGMKGFNQAFDTLHSKKKWIHCFPEGFRWDYYQPIRPFLKGIFTMAVKYELPVIPLAISYREPKGIYKLLKIKHPLITISIGEPILIDKNLSKKENTQKLRKEAHEQIVKMSGIEKNKWPVEGD